MSFLAGMTRLISLVAGVVLTALGATLLVYDRVTIAKTATKDLAIAEVSVASEAKEFRIPPYAAGATAVVGLLQLAAAARGPGKS